MLRHKVYPILIIQEVIHKRSGLDWFTKIDLSMFFYTLELEEESQCLCTIVTPFGKFQYCCLPMGIKMAPDEAQAIIEEIL
eukprot:11441150-Ditylum_brightwellii.AAC.1